MKKLLIIACTLFVAMPLFAQEKAANLDDKQRICITAFMDPEIEIPATAQKILLDRMNKAILKNGLGSSEGERFIMTANVNQLDVETTATAPVMYVVELEATFFIGDGIDGTLLSQGSINVKGADDSEEKAYLDAIKKIKVNDPAFKRMITIAKENIVNYYNTKCNFIISGAQTMAKNQQYDDAIFELTRVPDICEECYKRSMQEAAAVYQKKIDEEGATLISQARSEWSKGQNRAAADKAGAYLVKINPQSKAYAEGVALFNQMDNSIKAKDQQAWDYKMQKQQNDANIEQARIEAAKEVAVAQANSKKRHYSLITIRKWWGKKK
ncbi:MAG: hypothetical protein J5708_01960 [Bacteroidales bacterium]|nr:hypothetical protein [Bacteroidales bacterium]